LIHFYKRITMSGFSLGDIISGGKKGEVGELFSKKVGKVAPGYDYSVVPDRVPDIKIPEEVDEMDERTKQRKQKKQDKKKRKALEMEMAKNQAKKTKIFWWSGGRTSTRTGRTSGAKTL